MRLLSDQPGWRRDLDIRHYLNRIKGCHRHDKNPRHRQNQISQIYRKPLIKSRAHGKQQHSAAKQQLPVLLTFSRLLKSPAPSPPSSPPPAMRASRKPYISEALFRGKTSTCVTITGRLTIIRADRKRFTAAQQNVSFPISFFSRPIKIRLLFISAIVS